MIRNTGTIGRGGSAVRPAPNSVVSVARFRYDGAYAITGYRIDVQSAAVVSEEHRPGTTDHRSGARGSIPRAITPIRGYQV